MIWWLGAGIAGTKSLRPAGARCPDPLKGLAPDERFAPACSSLKSEGQGSATSMTDVYEPRKAADLAEAVCTVYALEI